MLAFILILVQALGSPSDAARPEPTPTVRRVCISAGVETYSAPRKQARIHRGTTKVPSRIGGGAYVQLTGAAIDGYQPVTLLRNGGTVWIRVTDPRSSAPTLCVPQAATMRVCGTGSTTTATATAAMHADFERPTDPPLMRIDRGTRVQLWEYFEDRGRWTFVERNGQAGFMRSEDLCHDDQQQPPGSEATTHFAMTVATAGVDCYQSHRERAAAEIRRIVIHNSENTLRSAIGTFRSCRADRPTSAHVAIDRDGRMYRLVEDRYAAFHTGGHDGGFNAVSLGIELIASGRPGETSMTPPQEASLVALVRFWMAQYHITIADRSLAASTRTRAYEDAEFWDAAVTLHRLISAGRGTDCPTFLWPDNIQGDEAFFRWRQRKFSRALASASDRQTMTPASAGSSSARPTSRMVP